MRADVLPYTALMHELDAIMLAHVEFPEIDSEFPASLSPRIIRDFLRGQLGFDRHLVLTDDLDMSAITNRYARGEDAKLAIRAGNDIALICHQTESADVAANAIGELPLGVIDDARQRIEHFRRQKLHGPLVWCEAHWQKTCDSIQKLAEQVPEADTGPAQSPVEEY